MFVSFNSSTTCSTDRELTVHPPGVHIWCLVWFSLLSLKMGNQELYKRRIDHTMAKRKRSNNDLLSPTHKTKVCETRTLQWHHCMFFFFWSVHSLSFFNLRLLITPVLSSNCSCIEYYLVSDVFLPDFDYPLFCFCFFRFFVDVCWLFVFVFWFVCFDFAPKHLCSLFVLFLLDIVLSVSHLLSDYTFGKLFLYNIAIWYHVYMCHITRC